MVRIRRYKRGNGFGGYDLILQTEIEGRLYRVGITVTLYDLNFDRAGTAARIRHARRTIKAMRAGL